MLVDREEAFKLLKRYLKDESNIRFSFAVEAVMRTIAKRLNQNQDLWGITGLLHNIDYEYTSGEPEKKGILSAQIVEGLLPEKGVNAIQANNYIYTDQIPTTSLDKGLIAVSTAVGFIREIVRNTSSKDLKQVDLDLVLNKFNDASFAPKFKRSRMELCEDFDMDLNTFLSLTLKRLKKGMVKRN
ncbi:MAG: hypothetical protein V5A64_01645 [Candidatus Thermoplasmatota archaeon]